MPATNVTRWVALAVLLMIGPVVLLGSQQTANPTIGPLIDISVSFKVDPRLLGGTYGGEQWVSSDHYTGAAAQDIVEARAMGTDAKGTAVRITPKWISSDTEIMTVSPGQVDRVKIHVKRAGESKLQVVADGITKEFSIKADTLPTKAIQVRITQIKAPRADASATHNSAESKSTAGDRQGSSAFNSEAEKISYALGVSIANNLRKQPIKVNQDALIRGYNDAVSGKTLLSEPDVQSTLSGLKEALRQNQDAQPVVDKDLATTNKHQGESFLAENKSKVGVVTLPSGLQYKVLKPGDGQKPSLNDKVVCNYRGTFLDGTEFDSSFKRGRPAMFAVAGVIPGWKEALQIMPVGSKWQLFIPSELAYGERGTPRQRRNRNGVKQVIGPNATLIFELELLSVEGNLDATKQSSQHSLSATIGESAPPSKETNQ
jgi:FKBP-type peptidyl-prolyl cis-trans isomerase FklB